MSNPSTWVLQRSPESGGPRKAIGQHPPRKEQSVCIQTWYLVMTDSGEIVVSLEKVKESIRKQQTTNDTERQQARGRLKTSNVATPRQEIGSPETRVVKIGPSGRTDEPLEPEFLLPERCPSMPKARTTLTASLFRSECTGAQQNQGYSFWEENGSDVMLTSALRGGPGCPLLCETPSAPPHFLRRVKIRSGARSGGEMRARCGF